MNKKISYMFSLLMATALFTSCKNGDISFSDYEKGTTVYFAYQRPVRTIVLGDDEYDTTMDKAHKFKILATFGGSYNGSNGSVQVSYDPSLVNNLVFPDGEPVKVMPEHYYHIQTTNFLFNGTMNGGTEVELTEDFFKDERSTKETFVIPLVMMGQSGFDRILTGTLKEGGQPVRTDDSQWEVLPMDYVLYCVKFQNKYSGYWLTNGTSSIDNIEKGKVVEVDCESLYTSVYHASWTTNNYQQYKRDAAGQKTSEIEKVSKTYEFKLLLTYDANDNCVITCLTPEYTGGGTGTWIDNGAVKSWGNKDRDLMDLSYKLDFHTTDELGNAIKADVHEKLVWQRSGVTLHEFSANYIK